MLLSTSPSAQLTQIASNTPSDHFYIDWRWRVRHLWGSSCWSFSQAQQSLQPRPHSILLKARHSLLIKLTRFQIYIVTFQTATLPQRNPALKMRCRTSVGVFLLLFLTSTALVAASPSVYLVKGWFGGEGIYEERSDPRLHYKRTVQPNSDGENILSYFLYTEPDHPDTWTLGRNDFDFFLKFIKPRSPLFIWIR